MEYVCNFTGVLPYPPQEEGANWEWYMSHTWERLVPFHAHVQPAAAACSSGKALSLRRFNNLPAELQLHILSFCAPCVLFQLMRTSSALRNEASKLFWADPNTYFLVDSQWLMDGGFPGDTCWDLNFLQHIQNIEVDHHAHKNTVICPQPDARMQVREDLVNVFWHSFRQRLPNAKRVVFNQNGKTRAYKNDTKPITQPLQILIQACPLEIEASAFILDTQVLYTKEWQRSLYRPAASGTWEKISLNQRHQTVLAPAKRFFGPVGRFQQMRHKASMNILQEFAHWPLMAQVLDRHHFNKDNSDPFSCPFPRCDAYLKSPGECTIHIAHSHFLERNLLQRYLPGELRVVFEERTKILDKGKKELERQVERMGDEWNRSKKDRQKIERGWMEQLENDGAWDTGKVASNSKLWQEFLSSVRGG